MDLETAKSAITPFWNHPRIKLLITYHLSSLSFNPQKCYFLQQLSSVSRWTECDKKGYVGVLVVMHVATGNTFFGFYQLSDNHDFLWWEILVCGVNFHFGLTIDFKWFTPFLTHYQQQVKLGNSSESTGAWLWWNLNLTFTRQRACLAASFLFFLVLML